MKKMDELMTRNRPPSFDFYPDDFVGGTMGMHPCARGIYISLLCYQWSHGAIPNPTNIRQFVQITGAMPDELKEHLPEVLLKFERRENGSFINARIEREYARKVEIREKRSAVGKSGAIAKQKQKQKPSICLSKSQSNSEVKQEVGSGKKEVSKDKKKSFDPSVLELPFSSVEFAGWWRSYSEMRIEKGCPMKPTGAKASLGRIAKFGESRAIAALEYTTANEWQGIREPEPESVPNNKVGPKTFAQQRIENSRNAIKEFCGE